MKSGNPCTSPGILVSLHYQSGRNADTVSGHANTDTGHANTDTGQANNGGKTGWQIGESY